MHYLSLSRVITVLQDEALNRPSSLRSRPLVVIHLLYSLYIIEGLYIFYISAFPLELSKFFASVLSQFFFLDENSSFFS